MKYLFYIMSVAAFLVLGFLAAKWYYQPVQAVSKENIEVVLDKIKDAFKIVTVEGEISELYDHKDYWGYDLFPLRKQMLVRVKGKIAVGFDLENVNIKVDEQTKTVYIGPFPQPQILSLDHDVDYYDINEGLFNSFTAADYTAIQKKIKDILKDSKHSEPLFQRAHERRDSLINTFDDILEVYNWHIQISEPVTPNQNNTNLTS